jgi:glutamate carboxypeptidase
MIEQEVAGNLLHADIRPAGSNAVPVLLLGHCDTVFPKGEAARRPFQIVGARAYGPGVADMKGGLVINAFVLAGLKALAPDGLPVRALFTSDEEIASPVSRDEITRTSRNVRAVFNAEPGRPSGNVTVGRKGGVFMRVDVEGRGAHSGSHFTYGISAVEELARKIIGLHALTDLDKGVTVNVGVVKGGLTLNTVARSASAEFELRYVALRIS